MAASVDLLHHEPRSRDDRDLLRELIVFAFETGDSAAFERSVGMLPLGATDWDSRAVARHVFLRDLCEACFPVDVREAGAKPELGHLARLLGAPPGYVGHDAGGQLTEPVRRRPYQLVLLDEIEKAHPDVLLALLPLLDEGRLTDGRGRTVDFTNTVVFMTSNLGADAPAASPRIGFGGDDAAAPQDGSEHALAAVRRALPPELFNRIDEPLWFGPLGRDVVAEIARRMLAGIGRSLEQAHGITLEVEPSAIDALIEAGGYDPTLGARPMRRIIGRLVESPLATRVLRRELGRVVRLRGEGATVCIEQLDALGADAAE